MRKVGHDLSDAEIAAAYERIGPSLGMRPYFYPAVAKFAGPIGAGVALDVGCGSGDLLFQIQKLNPDASLLGIELSESRVKMAQARLGVRADIRCGSLTGAIPFPPSSADIILITEVIEHLKDPVAALRNVVPILKLGGRVVITFPNGNSFLPFSFLAEHIAPHFNPARGFLPHSHPYRTIQPIDTTFSKSEVLEMLRASGLWVVKSACSEVFPYLLEFAYKFAPGWDISPWHRPLDRLASRFGLVSLGAHIFVECIVSESTGSRANKP